MIKRLAIFGTFLLVVLSVIPASAQECDGDFEEWSHRLVEFLQVDQGSEVDEEQLIEITTCLAETGPEPEEVQILTGRVYRFAVTDDLITINLPEHLGGETVTASLQGELTLFIETFDDESPPYEGPDGEPLARIWIVDIREEIGDIVLPLEEYEIELGTFVLSTNMIDETAFTPDEPQGTLNLETGEYKLNYVIRPNHPVLAEMEIEDLGTIFVHEQGTIEIDFDAGQAHLETYGSLSIESGFFEGTEISYSPKEGEGEDILVPATVMLNVFMPYYPLPVGGSCTVYAGTIQDAEISGAVGVGRLGGAIPPNPPIFFAVTATSPSGTSSRWPVANLWDTTVTLGRNDWDGEPLGGLWWAVHHIPCGAGIGTPFWMRFWAIVLKSSL